MFSNSGPQDLVIATDPSPPAVPVPAVGTDPAPQLVANPAKSKGKPKYGKTLNEYPARTVTYYQISTSDLMVLGASQFATTLFTSGGTFCLSIYLDYKKDVDAAGHAAEVALINTANNWFYASLFLFILASICFLFRKLELSRIVSEHGDEVTLVGAIKSRWKYVIAGIYPPIEKQDE